VKRWGKSFRRQRVRLTDWDRSSTAPMEIRGPDFEGARNAGRSVPAGPAQTDLRIPEALP